ncbi:protein disulfide-isomerase A3-like [Saccoglossus kowalevskii]|uniref:Protein disulfide-isomerase n=1 Tax=Saccoglossus kowalevskii TaxID=10224 RepID=A0ABM0GYH1_SACKO|nr:PREDICTED: protein disulfide-isomerase A3-like [Saccoglossus kowalevskii]
MQKFLSFALLVGLALASDVLELTDDDFEDTVAEQDIILVEFFAPWCGHCKKLAPEYEKAATDLKYSDPSVPLAKVDCTAEKDTCSRYGVSGYPTLKVFRDGEASDYNGPRSADGIIDYMKKQAGPTSREAKTVEDIDKLLSGKDLLVVGCFTDDSDAKKEFLKFAGSERDNYKFVHTGEQAVLDRLGTENGDIVIFRPTHLQSKFEDSKIKFDGTVKSGNLKKFVKENSLGLCGHMTPDNHSQFKKPLCVVYYDVDYRKNTKGTNYWRNRIMKVAKKLSDKKIFFAVANREEFSHEVEANGLTDKSVDLPVVAIVTDEGHKYPMQADFTRDGKALEEFVNDYLDGKIEPYLKSEPIPESDDGPVKVIVAKNFQDIVMSEEKDVLIEFYAPWCGHCKSLAPKYDELAEKLSADDNIVIAKMDATANDVPPPFEVRGFPTLYWVPMNNKPKKYEGGREVDDFMKYIKREATKGLNIPKKAKKDKEEL